MADKKLIDIDRLSKYHENINTLLTTKQESLVSGDNIKTINGESILGSGDLETCMVSITYSELKTLRDNSQLIPGMQYRITDYITTTTKADSQSAGHQFDVIVTADDESTLNEIARACLHEGDTYFSEAGANLEAWQIWYCLDNDVNRFDWASAKGKSIVVDVSAEGLGIMTATLNGTFVYNDTTYSRWDTSALIDGIFADVYILTPSEDVTIGSTPILYIPLMGYGVEGGTISLVIINENEGKGVIYHMIDEWNNDVPYDFKNIQFKRKLTDGALDLENGVDTWCYTFTSINEGNLKDESFNTATSNVFGVKCWDNVFLGDNCYFNTFGSSCRSNTFGDDCKSNSFGKECAYNSFGNYCSYNTFGDVCDNNSFVYYCNTNTFGNGCRSNTFGDFCGSNTFVSDCESNTFGFNCGSNTFGNGCRSNTFGSDCKSNSFGNRCESNTFGSSCYYNSFENDCNYNTFGNDCHYNTFGNGCRSNTFGNDADTLKSYYRYNSFGDGCRFIYLANTNTASSSIQVQNYKLAQGLQGTSESPITITTERNRGYETKVAKNSSGIVKIYCEVDNIDNIGDINTILESIING